MLFLFAGCVEEKIIDTSEFKEIVYTFEDYEFEKDIDLVSLHVLKYRGPGNIEQAEVAFTEYLNKKGWFFDSREDSRLTTTIYLKKPYNDDVKLLISEDYPSGVIVIIEGPYFN